MNESKPEPCPFCGDECYVDDGATPRVVCINKDSCCYQGAIAKTKAGAIAAHNRVCRAGEAVMTEAAQLLLGMKDCLEGIASEQGEEELERFAKCPAMLLARSGQVALALKAMADEPQGYYELMIRNLYQSEESPTTSAYRTIEAAVAD